MPVDKRSWLKKQAKRAYEIGGYDDGDLPALNKHVFVFWTAQKKNWLHNENSINHWPITCSHTQGGPMPIISSRHITKCNLGNISVFSFDRQQNTFNSGMTLLRLRLPKLDSFVKGGGEAKQLNWSKTRQSTQKVQINYTMLTTELACWNFQLQFARCLIFHSTLKRLLRIVK